MLVSEFMTKEVFALKPTDSLFRAAQFMFEKNFDGLPVVLDDSTLVGIITQYDLISKGANIHLPTFMKLMNEFSMYKKDKSLLKPELQKIVSLTVKDLMNPEPITVSPDLPMETAATVFSEHHRVNPIPVINEEHKILGVISRFDADQETILAGLMEWIYKLPQHRWAKFGGSTGTLHFFRESPNILFGHGCPI